MLSFVFSWRLLQWVLLALFVSSSTAAPTHPDTRSSDSILPILKLDNATFIGAATDLTNSVHKFLGIPFAQRKRSGFPSGATRFEANSMYFTQRRAFISVYHRNT